MTTAPGWTGGTPSAVPGSRPDGEVPRLRRNPRGSVLGGVARGLSEHLGLDVSLVRGLFLVLALADGAGVLLYAAFWVLAPLRRGPLDPAPVPTPTPYCAESALHSAESCRWV